MALALGTPVVAKNGEYVTVPVTGATLPLKPNKNVSGFLLEIAGVNVELEHSDVQGANLLLAPVQAVRSTDTVTLKVIDSNLSDSASTPNVLANITVGAAVTNSSAVTDKNHSTIDGDPVGKGQYVAATNDQLDTTE